MKKNLLAGILVGVMAMAALAGAGNNNHRSHQPDNIIVI